MSYVSIKQIAVSWDLSNRTIIEYCKKKIISDFIIEDEVVSIKAENIRYVFVTSAKFDTKVYDEASESNIILIDGERLSEMVFERIDKLDELRYKLGYIKKFEHID
jgi:restriction endonuclease Mrr